MVCDILDHPEVGEGGVAEAARDVEGRADVAEGDGMGGGVREGDGEFGCRELMATGGYDDWLGDGEGDEDCG